jgi:signal transduction histidine kinase
MTSLSIKWRITLLISVVLTAVIFIISIVAYNEFEESHLRDIDRTIQAMAEGITASLDEISDKERWANEVGKLTGGSDKDFSFIYRIWLDGAASDLLSGQSPDSEQGRWLCELSEQYKPSVENSKFINIGLPHNEYRAIWMRHKINGDIMNIAVAGSSHFTFHEMHEFLRLLIILGAGLILSSVIAIAWTVRCCLRPIDITAERLQDITYPRIRQVIYDSKKTPKELSPFIEALNDMLDRLDRILQQQKQFTSDAAHELRTPLSLAKTTLQAAQMHIRQSDEYRQTINDSLEDIARMEYLIEQLLILARLDEVKHDINTGEVQLDILLRELSESYDKKMRRTGGKVIFEKSPDITIQGSLDELIRLFSNVLDNAAKYGPENGTISISLKTEPDGYVIIDIHDEGGQIPPDSIPHIFDRFYRVDPSRSKTTGGAGLGLAISREIALRHNGDISITSSTDSGTLVTIRLARY